jgi:hypothetical protein
MMCLGLMAMMKQVSSRWSVGDLLSERKKLAVGIYRGKTKLCAAGSARWLLLNL